MCEDEAQSLENVSRITLGVIRGRTADNPPEEQRLAGSVIKIERGNWHRPERSYLRIRSLARALLLRRNQVIRS